MYNQFDYGLGTNKSVIRELFTYGLEQAKKVGADKVYDYSLGNPSIPAPAIVNKTAIDIINNVDPLQVHGYSSAPGFDDVREKVAKNLTERMGMTIKGSNLYFTCGAAPGLVSIFHALHANDDCKLLAIAPFFPEYRPFAQASGLQFDFVEADTKAFQINMAALEAKLDKNTQAVIINSPNNPSGVVFSEATLKQLGEILTRKSKEFGHPIYLIADEPYRELVYGGVKVPWVPNFYKNTIVAYSWSKSLSLPGERIGYVCVPDCVEDGQAIFSAITGAARAIGHVCPPTLIQRVVAECCSTMPDLEAYDDNRQTLYEGLLKIGYECAKPDGAFYLFVKAPGGDANKFSEACKKYNLLVVPSDSFGVPGYFRLCYCVSKKTIVNSMEAFEKAFNEFK